MTNEVKPLFFQLTNTPDQPNIHRDGFRIQHRDGDNVIIMPDVVAAVDYKLVDFQFVDASSMDQSTQAPMNVIAGLNGRLLIFGRSQFVFQAQRFQSIAGKKVLSPCGLELDCHPTHDINTGRVTGWRIGRLDVLSLNQNRRQSHPTFFPRKETYFRRPGRSTYGMQ